MNGQYYDDPDLANDIAEIVKHDSNDFTVQNEGSIFVLYAKTLPAREWVNENLPDDVTTWGVNGYVVEHRYIMSIIDGIRQDGLSVGQAS